MIKILHAADFHMDSPFYSLPEEKAAQRRAEQRELLLKLADAAEDVDIVLLAGDLFDTGAGYWETTETLKAVLSGMKARVFIAPGNHDYYTARSPYAFMELPENVHIFKTPQIRPVEIPELGVRVWGAGFSSGSCDPLLSHFSLGKTDFLELAVVHGDVAARSRYNAVTEDEIARTGLAYLALGHVHTFSGIKKAGETYYAYPGCLEGRGFDETGPKGYIKGTLDRGRAELDFVPIGGREYRIIEADLTGERDALEAVKRAVGEGFPRDIGRILLKGEFSGEADTEAIREAVADKFYHVTVKSAVRQARDVWEGAGEDSLRGMFLKRLRERYDGEQDEEERKIILAAARYGAAVLEGREEAGR